MDCKNCPYYGADTEEYIGEDGETHLRTVGRERCQYNHNDGYAPCETGDCDYDPLDCEDTSLLQKSVYQLEAYKRRLGRNVDKATNPEYRRWYIERYNDCERSIDELCTKYKLDRKSKPYTIKED